MVAPILIFLRGPLAGRRVTLDSDEFIVGRGSSSDIVLHDPLVSRAHAIVMRRGDVMLIEDLGSHNGTYLNDERLHSVRQMRHGDRITIGDSRLLFEDPSQFPEDSTQVSEQVVFAGSSLTQRQIQVLRLMARGLSNKEIGARLFVSERTVKAYASVVFEKLEVNTRAAAVAAAMRAGLIDSGGDSGD
ncbi:MAG: FHA domain-containing protein [Actinomycetota bacterium]